MNRNEHKTIQIKADRKRTQMSELVFMKRQVDMMTWTPKMIKFSALLFVPGGRGKCRGQNRMVTLQHLHNLQCYCLTIYRSGTESKVWKKLIPSFSPFPTGHFLSNTQSWCCALPAIIISKNWFQCIISSFADISNTTLWNELRGFCLNFHRCWSATAEGACWS